MTTQHLSNGSQIEGCLRNVYCMTVLRSVAIRSLNPAMITALFSTWSQKYKYLKARAKPGCAGGPNLKAQRLMTAVHSGVTERPHSRRQTSGVGFPPQRTPDAVVQDMVSLKETFSNF